MRHIPLHFEIAENILYTLNQTEEEFISQIRLFTALQLFKTHKLSWGQAADLANLTKEQFLGELDQHQIPLIDYDTAELATELKRFQTCESSPIPPRFRKPRLHQGFLNLRGLGNLDFTKVS